MATATSRVQIAVPTYMKVDGQWQIVLPGAIIDLDDKTRLSPASIVPSFNQAVGTLKPHGGATAVTPRSR